MLPSEAAKQQLAALSSLSPPLQAQVATLTRAFVSNGVAASFTKLVEGPVVLTFYFQPLGYAQLSKLYARQEDIALSLGVESVLIARELGLITVQVPRAQREIVAFDSCLHDMMTSTATADMILPLLMGVSPQGEKIYADLSSQPHLLIAGATNSGKSIFTAQVICSLALFRSPEEMDFVLVDTKNLDLVLFKSLEHVKQIVTSAEDLVFVLSELLEEVRKRNEMMSGFARNIREWNAFQENYWNPSRRDLISSNKLKYKVLIIDEFADVIMQDSSGMVLKLVKQLAQISRAAGVHLIVATQRPSVKIIDGDIKTNLPARICFKLPSMTDSRVVLDENGAENLLGMGDYLYKIAGSDTVRRAHSAFVSTTTIATIIAQNEMIRRQYARR